MKFIAHRGNMYGPDEMENSISHIENAIYKGYDAEIDLWRINGRWYSGHDNPYWTIKDVGWLDDHRSQLWCHAKNLDALRALLDMKMHCFWHNQDAFTLTSNGYIWVHQDIAFQIEDTNVNTKKLIFVQSGRPIPVPCHGVCADYALSI